MDVVSTAPIPATGFRWLLSNGAPALTVVCKATFLLQQGEASLAPQQEPLAADDAYWEAEPDRLSPAMTDLVPYKARADVVLVGHAYAPQRQPARSLLVRAVVGSMDKSIEVCNSRVFMPNGELKEGPRWLEQPLGWDRAAGGPDTSNPAGMRFDAPDALGRIALPTLQPPGAHVARRGDTFAPIGFGPIPPAWPSRAVKLYQHARAFSKRDWPSRPIPDPIDHAFFNIAPPDQQIDEIRSDERIVLTHLHPDHPRLVTHLPGIAPSATVQRQGRAPAALALACDTLWIDTDRQICTLVWRGTLALAHASEPGQVVVSLDGVTSAQQPSPPSPRDARPFTRAETVTQPAQPAKRSPGSEAALPFQTGAFALRNLGASSVVPAPPSQPVSARPSLPAPEPADPPQRARTMDMPEALGASLGAQSNAAPFRQAASTPLPGTVAPVPAPVAPPVPAPVAPPVPVPVAAPPVVAQSLGSSGSWGLGAPEPRAPQGSIGERLAVEQAMAESKALLEKRGSDEVDPVGPLARPPSPPAESAGPAPARDTGARRPAPGARDARDAVLLLWLDSGQVPRIYRKPAFREILDELEEQEPDPELDASVEGAPADVDDHRAVFEILVRGAATDAEGLQRAMVQALREDGKYIAPLVLLAGEIAFPFDELETLRATVVTASPLAGADEPLKAAIGNAREFLDTPNLTCAPAVAEGMTARIRDAFAQGKRVVPPGYLDAQTERVLLEQRHYQKRTVLGAPHLRALFHLAGAQAPVPAYLPAAAAPRLPLFQRFRARLLATCHIAEDQNETHPAALKVLALARIAPAPAIAAPRPSRP